MPFLKLYIWAKSAKFGLNVLWFIVFKNNLTYARATKKE